MGINDEVILNYRKFEEQTVKIFVDALYKCNVKPIPLEELLKLLQFTSKLGFTESINGKQDFECTVKEWGNIGFILYCTRDIQLYTCISIDCVSSVTNEGTLTKTIRRFRSLFLTNQITQAITQEMTL